MSVKKQIPSLSNLYTIYKEVPEIFLDETDVDGYFYNNILDIALIDNRIVPVRKGSNKKVFLSIYFGFERKLEKSIEIHSWTGGISFNKRICSYFKDSTPVFETIR